MKTIIVGILGIAIFFGTIYYLVDKILNTKNTKKDI
jgi:hypothetical protein